MSVENNIPEGWVETTLGEVCEIKHGFAFKGKFITLDSNNKILITPGNFKVGGGFKNNKFKYYTGDFPNDYILKQDDVIITMTDLSKEGDTLGFSAKVPTDNKIYLHNQRIGLVQFKNTDFDKEFIYWLLRTTHYQKSIVNSATGSTVRHTSPKRIQEYIFFSPTFSEQKAIAAILTAFDDKIENLQAQNKTLETIAQTIFKEWFGEEADNWELVEIHNLLEISSSKRIFFSEYVNNGIPFYRSKEIIELSTKPDISTELFISVKRFEEIKDKFEVPKKGDILLTAVGTLGVPFQVRNNNPFYFNWTLDITPPPKI